MSDYSFSLDYSTLFNTTSSYTNNYSNPSSGASSASSAYSGYGVNNSTLTEEQKKSILSYSSAANKIQSALSSLMSEKTDGSSIFGSYSAKSANTDALTASYNNYIDKYSSEALLARRDPDYKPAAPEELAVKTLRLAQTQKNTGASLAADGMALEAGKTYRFEINDGSKTTEVSFVTEAGDTNESIQNKIANAINDKNIGVKASVVYDGANNTNRLVLESRETGITNGKERAFTVTDKSGYDAVSRLGLDNMTQEAQNAQYFVKDSEGNVEYKESRSNTVQLTDRTSATLKAETDDYVGISFSNDTKDGINAVRELVNGYNALFDEAANGSTTQSARLASQLVGLYGTYAKQLNEVGITINGDGYLEIDEDKMQAAADSGELGKLFNPDEAGANYGFAQRLGNIANTVADNPNQYAVSRTSNTSSGGANTDFWEELNNGASGSYSKLYFNLLKYENMGSLFNSMF